MAKEMLARYAGWQRRWREPILTALLILLCCEVFLDVPLSGQHESAASIIAIVLFVLIVATAMIATRHRAAACLMLASATLALISNVLRIDEPSVLTICVGAASCAAFMFLLSWVIWCAVYGPGLVTYHRIRGAVVIYLSIALAFAALYELLVALLPGAIRTAAPLPDYPVVGADLMYYSFTTLTSVGYGDLLPVHPLARSLSNLESVIGQVFPAVFVARIVALEAHARHAGSE